MTAFLSAAALWNVAPITVSPSFTNPTGASPQTTNSPTVTVPVNNSGVVTLGIGGTGAANVTYSDNGGAFGAVSSGDNLGFVTGHTAAFKLTGAARTATVTIADNSTLATVATITLTNT